MWKLQFQRPFARAAVLLAGATTAVLSMPGTGHGAPAGGVPGISKTAPPSPRERSGVQPSAGAPPLPDKAVEASPLFGPVPSWGCHTRGHPDHDLYPRLHDLGEAQDALHRRWHSVVSVVARKALVAASRARRVSTSRGAGARSTVEGAALESPSAALRPHTERGRRISGVARECARRRPCADGFSGSERTLGEVEYSTHFRFDANDYRLLSVNPCCRRSSKAGRPCA